MREIDAAVITSTVKRLCQEANYFLPEDVVEALHEAFARERSPLGREILKQILENARLAREEQLPLCQDTGSLVAWVEVGQEAHITGASLEEAINAGVRHGYKEGYLRASIVGDPLNRKNTGDNTPAAIHYEMVPGDRLRLRIMPKGGGCENMTRMTILRPADGAAGVKAFVVDSIVRAQANPCPPVIVGVGIGGTAEQVVALAKKALFRPVKDKHPNPYYAALEEELLSEINDTGVGPQGLGGIVTALAVKIETAPCHITALPVAVNLNCHSARVKEAIL